MKKVNNISILIFVASFVLVGCSKMTPLNQRQECGTSSKGNSANTVESTAISTSDEGAGTGSITDPDHDTDHDRDKSKPKVQ